MRPLKALRRRPFSDPAPSRVAYRLNRLWLTPGFHRFLRLGLPMVLITSALIVIFSDAERRGAMGDWVVEIQRSIEERPEFMVNLMAIDGATDDLAMDIREVLPVDLPASSFDLDLEAMRLQVESLDAVQRVDMQVKTGGVLQIVVTERVPSVVWRSEAGLELLDAKGNRVSGLESRKSHAELLLVAGAGADAAVPEAMALAAALGPLTEDLIGLMRIAELRWDVVLNGGHRIMLPEEDPQTALYQAVAMAEAQALIRAGKVTRIDFRNPKRPILRLAEGAYVDRDARGGLIDVKDN